MNKFYVVGTPIGNMEDITLRAMRVLSEVDLILCEDTRVSQKLLNHYEIKNKTKSYHKFNEKQTVGEIISLLKEGKNIALISDAGTPLISDPGSELLKCAIENGIKITPLAGASALTTFMSGVNNPCGQFLFLGFFPKKQSGKELLLQKHKALTVIFYESPNRLIKTLEDIHKVFPEAQVAVGRELTKIFEEIRQGYVREILEYYKKNPPKGEIAVAIIGQVSEVSGQDMTEQILKLGAQNYSVNDISKIISTLFGLPKKEIYSLAIELLKK